MILVTTLEVNQVVTSTVKPVFNSSEVSTAIEGKDVPVDVHKLYPV